MDNAMLAKDLPGQSNQPRIGGGCGHHITILLFVVARKDYENGQWADRQTTMQG